MIIENKFMIKRAGVELMNARTKNVSVSKETLAVIKQKHYLSLNGNKVDISSVLNESINNTVFYQNELPFEEYEAINPLIEVTEETTGQAARRYAISGKDIVVLNFASARNPGGGFLSGAMAQEEDLCRCSGLYSCIKNKPIFYNNNILCDNTYYTDGIIYSPKVPFFRDEHLLFMEEPFLASVITAPAPNVRSMENLDKNELYTILCRRAYKILQVAAANNHKNIILGAWGCGAFGNNAEMVSKVFMEALQLVPAFENVCFAIYENSVEKPIFEIFKKKIFDKDRN